MFHSLDTFMINLFSIHHRILQKKDGRTDVHEMFTIDLVAVLPKWSREAYQVRKGRGLTTTCAIAHSAAVLVSPMP